MRTEKKQILAMVLVVAMVMLSGASFLEASAEAKTKVNINTAGLKELQTLPRIGEKVAQRIIDFRKKNGPFKRVEDLLKVKGIGEKTFLRFKDRVTI
ncbi:MAG TPA: helix-hairpin-helix domain-containing protein [Candidatus Aminicenantes bacterium]|nr:helix-hairpin-helix domain-containing protein [Candidatus Aminicenantes bacterium]